MVTVGGVLTYEDVTNVDSVGVVTANLVLSLVHQVLVEQSLQLEIVCWCCNCISFVGAGTGLSGVASEQTFRVASLQILILLDSIQPGIVTVILKTSYWTPTLNLN